MVIILTWCFHVPDEDWILSKDNSWNIENQNDEELNEALNSFFDSTNIISSEWKSRKNNNSGSGTESWEILIDNTEFSFSWNDEKNNEEIVN